MAPIGCYSDDPDVHDLPLELDVEDEDVLPSVCVEECGKQGRRYASTQQNEVRENTI